MLVRYLWSTVESTHTMLSTDRIDSTVDYHNVTIL